MHLKWNGCFSMTNYNFPTKKVPSDSVSWTRIFEIFDRLSKTAFWIPSQYSLRHSSIGIVFRTVFFRDHLAATKYSSFHNDIRRWQSWMSIGLSPSLNGSDVHLGTKDDRTTGDTYIRTFFFITDSTHPDRGSKFLHSTAHTSPIQRCSYNLFVVLKIYSLR